MIRNGALHRHGLDARGVPRGLCGSSLREPIIVSALHLEIGETLHLETLQLELLNALNLELRWANGFCLERARQTGELHGLRGDSRARRDFRLALHLRYWLLETLPGHTQKTSRSVVTAVNARLA